MRLDPDLALVVGLGLGLLSLLSIVSAWTEARFPALGVTVLALGLALVAAALVLSPDGYSPMQMPDVIFTVLGRYVL